MIRSIVSAGIVALALIASMSAPAAAETARGTWTLDTVGSGLQLQMHWRDAEGRHSEEDSHVADAQQLGIAAALASSGEHTTFALHREAGDYAFDGWIGNGQGSGSYVFTPNDPFFASLQSLGYDVSLGQKMAFANLDITMAYVRSMEALGFKGDTNHLIAMRALGVTPDYVRGLAAEKIGDLTAQHVIAMRAMHIDQAYIDDLSRAGLPHVTAQDYITLKAMRVDGAYIRYLQSHGLKNLTVHQIVSMKATGV